MNWQYEIPFLPLLACFNSVEPPPGRFGTNPFCQSHEVHRRGEYHVSCYAGLSPMFQATTIAQLLCCTLAFRVTYLRRRVSRAIPQRLRRALAILRGCNVVSLEVVVFLSTSHTIPPVGTQILQDIKVVADVSFRRET